MRLSEIAYMILETIRDAQIVDDEKVDPRLIEAWVKLKRADFIKKNQNTNPNNRVNHNMYQTELVEVEVLDVTDAGDYPYANSITQDYEFVRSTTTLPNIIEDKSGPIILSVESQDRVKLPFCKTSYDQLRFAGNGKFNSNIIFYAFRDKYLYFKYNPFFDTYTNVEVRAVFEDPTEVTGFDAETDDYPVSADFIEYIKNSIYDIDIRVLLSGKSDTANDASGEI